MDDEDKIKRAAEIGAKLNFVPQILLVVFALGWAITNVVQALSDISAALYITLSVLFLTGMAASLVLVIVGGHYQRTANRAVFNYCEELTSKALPLWLDGDSLSLKVTLSEGKDNAVFTADDGRHPPVVYDLTCAVALSSSATAFVSSCICGMAKKVARDIKGGKVYKDVVYSIKAGDTAEEQYLIKNGAADEKELKLSVDLYEKACKKYRK